MNVAQQILKILEEIGLTQIWGVTGDALNSFTDALQRHKFNIKWNAVRYEENSAFAAGTEVQCTRNLAVCAGTVGPGILHLINDLNDAKKECFPVLAINGQVARVNIGTNYFQGVGLTKIFDDVCAYQVIIRSAEEALRVVLRAIKISLEQIAVVHVEISDDIATQDAAGERFIHPVIQSNAVLISSDSEIHKVTNVLNEGKKITILTGAGCTDYKDDVMVLSEKLKAPIVHTFRLSDTIHKDDKNVVGLTGLIGNPSEVQVVMHTHVLLMLHTDLPYTNFLPDDRTIIQIDKRLENIGNRAIVNIGVHGNCEAVVSKLLKKVTAREKSKFLDHLADIFSEWKKTKTENSEFKNNEVFSSAIVPP